MNGGTEMDVREKLLELLTNSPQLDVLDWATGWEEAANYLIAHGVTVQEWISVNDRLPEDDLPKDTKKKMIRCLVYTNKGTIKPCVRQRWEVNGKLVHWQWNKDLFAKPTHWMYYPQPPKGERKKL